jgi:hypothetical protein
MTRIRKADEAKVEENMHKDAKTHHDGPAVDRRQFLTRSAAATAAIIISGPALIHAGEAWGLEVKTLKPETMRTLIKMARDTYPHDRVADKFYAIAVKPYDEKAAGDAAIKSMIEAGIVELDALAMDAHRVPYADVAWEDQRVALLHKIENGTFFQTVRSGLIGDLYNQKEIWPIFGYEGESASKGGYLHRGFDDITWL